MLTQTLCLVFLVAFFLKHYFPGSNLANYPSLVCVGPSQDTGVRFSR